MESSPNQDSMVSSPRSGYNREEAIHELLTAVGHYEIVDRFHPTAGELMGCLGQMVHES